LATLLTGGTPLVAGLQDRWLTRWTARCCAGSITRATQIGSRGATSLNAAALASTQIMPLLALDMIEGREKSSGAPRSHADQRSRNFTKEEGEHQAIRDGVR